MYRAIVIGCPAFTAYGIIHTHTYTSCDGLFHVFISTDEHSNVLAVSMHFGVGLHAEHPCWISFELRNASDKT